MNETQQLLRHLFQTQNALTVPVSATGDAGMEACFVNLVEPGDEVVVAVNGVFGTRMSDIVNRIGGKLVKVDGEWGRAVDAGCGGQGGEGMSAQGRRRGARRDFHRRLHSAGRPFEDRPRGRGPFPGGLRHLACRDRCAHRPDERRCGR